MSEQIGFLRRCELRIRVEDRVAYTWKSDGRRDTIGISFNIVKTNVGQPNESTIVLSNVSEQTKESLMTWCNFKLYVSLFVGYENKPLTLLAQGTLIKLWPEKNGVSNTFTLYLLDGMPAIGSSHIEKTFPPNYPLAFAVEDVAKSFAPDIDTDKSSIWVNGKLPARGYTASGKASTVLDALARAYAFTWTIQNGVFYAYTDKQKEILWYLQSSKSIHEISLKERNLFKATPQLGEKYMQQVGMKIEALLNPNCRCGDVVHLQSGVYSMYDGYYQIHNITFTGDTKSTDWKMEIDSKNIVGQIKPQ